jgi:prevent-host-death family protein
MTIVPVSDLRDSNKVLSQVSYGNEVTLTKNGKAQYAIIDIEELERIRTEIWLMSELRKSEISIEAGHNGSSDVPIFLCLYHNMEKERLFLMKEKS